MTTCKKPLGLEPNQFARELYAAIEDGPPEFVRVFLGNALVNYASEYADDRKEARALIDDLHEFAVELMEAMFGAVS